MNDITIKFKDRNRSDLKLKTMGRPEYWVAGLVVIKVACKNGVSVEKAYSIDSIEEITFVSREDSSNE